MVSEIIEYIKNTPLNQDIIFYFLLSLIPLIIIIFSILKVIDNLKKNRRKIKR